MLRDRDSLAIVRAVLSLAAALGMNTTAEGVETIELGQTLGALGCTLGQGWHYSRPLSPMRPLPIGPTAAPDRPRRVRWR
jgi:EAL domain-containing protein (putative c-di-GMP-specific phosphodiesterase class I)